MSLATPDRRFGEGIVTHDYVCKEKQRVNHVSGQEINYRILINYNN